MRQDAGQECRVHRPAIRAAPRLRPALRLPPGPCRPGLERPVREPSPSSPSEERFWPNSACFALQVVGFQWPASGNPKCSAIATCNSLTPAPGPAPIGACSSARPPLAPAPRARSPTSPTASSAPASGCASAPCATSAVTSPCRAGTGRRCAPASSAPSIRGLLPRGRGRGPAQRRPAGAGRRLPCGPGGRSATGRRRLPGAGPPALGRRRARRPVGHAAAPSAVPARGAGPVRSAAPPSSAAS